MSRYAWPHNVTPCNDCGRSFSHCEICEGPTGLCALCDKPLCSTCFAEARHFRRCVCSTCATPRIPDDDLPKGLRQYISDDADLPGGEYGRRRK